MSDMLVLRGKNEETLLPRVLRVLAQQGLKVQALYMEAVSDKQELELEITFCNTGAEQAVKLLAKQAAVLAVNLGYEMKSRAV